MSESDDTDYLLSIPHNYFVVNENDIDWNKQHTTFIDEVNKFLFYLNRAENTPTNTDSEMNAQHKDDKQSVSFFFSFTTNNFKYLIEKFLFCREYQSY